MDNLLQGEEIQAGRRLLMSLSHEQVDTCSLLLQGFSVSEVAGWLKVKPIAVYQRRLRAEQTLGIRFPRHNRLGRPLRPLGAAAAPSSN